MRKLLPLIVIGILVLMGLEASAIQTEVTMNWGQTNIFNASGDDELDQSQTEMDFFAPVGNIFLAPEINYITAQSFKPTKNWMTRVEILVGKNSTAQYDFTLAIREDLSEPDLTSKSLPPGDFVTENFSWVEFDFDDIQVEPDTKYYIVCYTQDSVDNWYAWGAQLSDVYPNGMVWWSEDDGDTWEPDIDADLAFKTYGFDNTAPEEPEIDGPPEGTVGRIYEYEISATDPDGDDVYYCIDWDDDTGEVCVGPYSSGETIYLEHIYYEAETYTIKVKARDIHDAESDWAEFQVTMQKVRSVQNRFLSLIERVFQNRFLILRDLLQQYIK